VRVVFVCPTHFSAKSVLAGAERYAFELARAMARRTPTTLVTFGDEALQSKEGDLAIHCYRRWLNISGNPMNPLTPMFLRDIARADVVHCLQYGTVATDLAVLASVIGRKRVFVTDLAGSAAVTLWYRLRLWKGVREFLLISEYNRSLLERFDAPKYVIYGGVDVERFRPQPEVRRETVLFAGRLLAHKGIEVLLDALEPDQKAVIVGQAPSADYAAALVARAAGKQVEFKRDCTDVELLAEYHRARVVALPSLQDSGYTTALEAMACGIPVVGSTVGSLPELLADGETGFIVPANDPAALRAKLRALAEDRDLAERMGAAGRRRVERMFTWDQIVDRCLHRYRA
jgi:glycosyltransferase involved in cell wall biosynthesis